MCDLFVPGVLVVGREASRVGGLGDLAVVDLLEGVDALAGGRHGVHQMHGSGIFGEVCRLRRGARSLVICSSVARDLSFT